MKTEITADAKRIESTGRPNVRFEPLEGGYFLAIDPKGARRWRVCRVVDGYPFSTHLHGSDTRKAALRFYEMQRAIALHATDKPAARAKMDELAREEWAEICRKHPHASLAERKRTLAFFMPVEPSWWAEVEAGAASSSTRSPGA